MKLIGSIFAGAATLVLMAMPAHAFPPLWSAAAKGCVPDEASAGKYSTTGPGVAHLNANVDHIRLVCAIKAPFEGGEWKLVTTYRDSTGTTTSAYVSAQLQRLSRTTGNGSVVASFNSNNSTATGVEKDETVFNHTFNFDANYYYVVLQLDRAVASQIVQVFGVAIEANEPV